VQDLRRLTLAVCSGILLLLQGAGAEVVSIATWNLEWFPGGKPTSTEAERLVHMSAAKDALLDLHADILCVQEVRDWDSVTELVSILPGFQPLVVSRSREMGSSGPSQSSRSQLHHVGRLSQRGQSPLSRRPPRLREAFPLLQSDAAAQRCWSIRCTSRATAANCKVTSPNARRPLASYLRTPPRWNGFRGSPG
jgi:hypothetical protein